MSTPGRITTDFRPSLNYFDRKKHFYLLSLELRSAANLQN